VEPFRNGTKKKLRFFQNLVHARSGEKERRKRRINERDASPHDAGRTLLIFNNGKAKHPRKGGGRKGGKKEEERGGMSHVIFSRKGEKSSYHLFPQFRLWPRLMKREKKKKRKKGRTGTPSANNVGRPGHKSPRVFCPTQRDTGGKEKKRRRKERVPGRTVASRPRKLSWGSSIITLAPLS